MDAPLSLKLNVCLLCVPACAQVVRERRNQQRIMWTRCHADENEAAVCMASRGYKQVLKSAEETAAYAVQRTRGRHGKIHHQTEMLDAIEKLAEEYILGGI